MESLRWKYDDDAAGTPVSILSMCKTFGTSASSGAPTTSRYGSTRSSPGSPVALPIYAGS
jgi:hypothetical protein